MKNSVKTKDRIVLISLELFNKESVVAVTTNHIAKELNISPGNLYFHFRNKEEIIRQIFKMMCHETYQLWRVKKGQHLLTPLELIEKNYELFWRFRFFHRELYLLRERDPILSKQWRVHTTKLQRMREVWILPIQSKNEVDFMATVILATASNFLQFFESSETITPQLHLETGKRYVSWLLMPWTQGQTHQDFEAFVFSAQNSRPPQNPRNK
jgi:AcrR family transcriptional regulator